MPNMTNMTRCGMAGEEHSTALVTPVKCIITPEKGFWVNNALFVPVVVEL